MPFFVIPVSNMPFRLSREILAIWMGVGLVMAFTPSWWFRGFMALALVHLIVNPASIAYWDMMLLCGFCGIYAVIRKMDDEWMQWLLMGVCLVALVQAVLIFVQFAGLWEVEGYPCGMLANSNDAGAFLALSLPAFAPHGAWRMAHGANKILYIVLSALCVLAALVATRCTTGFVAAGAGITLWLILEKRIKRSSKAVGLGLMVMLSVVFFLKIDPIKYTLWEHPRWFEIERTVKAIKDKPWGYGLGSFKELFPMMTATDPRLGRLVKTKDGRYKLYGAREQAHNEYLQMTFELGWPFLVLIDGFLASFIYRLLRVRTTHGAEHMAACGLVILAVGCAGFFWLHLPESAFLGVMWLAIWGKSSRVQGSTVQGSTVR